jgi:hypothetical protein
MCRGGMLMTRLRICPSLTAVKCSAIASRCQPDTKSVDGSRIGQARAVQRELVADFLHERLVPRSPFGIARLAGFPPMPAFGERQCLVLCLFNKGAHQLDHPNPLT